GRPPGAIVRAAAGKASGQIPLAALPVWMYSTRVRDGRTGILELGEAMDKLSLVPHLIVRGGAEAIDFYVKAFGATEVRRMPGPDGKRLMHAELAVNGHTMMLCDEFPEYGGALSPAAIGNTAVVLHMHVPNVDEAYGRAV